MKKTIFRKPWFVYIVECRDNTLYTGIAINVKRRVHEHCTTKKCRYTRTRQPVVLRYKQRLPDHASAGKRESAIKRLPRQAKVALFKKKPKRRK